MGSASAHRQPNTGPGEHSFIMRHLKADIRTNFFTERVIRQGESSQKGEWAVQGDGNHHPWK